MDLNLLGIFGIAIAVGVGIDIERDEGRLVSVSFEACGSRRWQAYHDGEKRCTITGARMDVSSQRSSPESD